jgi:hypothetical protein
VGGRTRTAGRGSFESGGAIVSSDSIA